MKEEFYKQIIDIHKKCGQGLSGIVKVSSAQYARYLDEFIEEGLIKACHTGNSLGHPESNIFYMPTKGYNVWEDEGTDGQYSRHKGRYLTYVRVYLGAMEKERPEGEEINFINATMVDFVRDHDFMVNYVEWLKRNDESLKEMLALDTFYKAPKVEFSKEELEWIKSKEWYKNNETIEEYISSSNEEISLKEEELKLLNQILSLCKKDPNKYENKISETKIEIRSVEKEILLRKKIQNWSDSVNKEMKIQELL